MLIYKKSLTKKDKNKIKEIGGYPSIPDFAENNHKLHGKKVYILPKLDGVNLRVIKLSQDRYALITRQGYVADEFINVLNIVLPAELFTLANRCIVVIEFESIIFPNTSIVFCEYNIIDLFDYKEKRRYSISKRNLLCKKHNLQHPNVIKEICFSKKNKGKIQNFANRFINTKHWEGLIFEVEETKPFKLRFKNNIYESKVMKAEQEYSKIFLETGSLFLDFGEIKSIINKRLICEFGSLPSKDFIKKTYKKYCKKILKGANELIQLYSENPISDPITILLGGNNGVGKTTIARELCGSLKIDHRIGTGLIREIAKIVNPNVQELFNHTWEIAEKFHLDSSYEGVKLQSFKLNDPIKSLLERSRNEGTSIIIEGNHVIPEIIKENKTTMSLVLELPNRRIHYRRVKGKSHSKREVTREDFNKIIEIQKEIIKRAKNNGISIITNKNIPESIKKITVLLSINLLSKLKTAD